MKATDTDYSRPLTDFDRPQAEGPGITRTEAAHARLYSLRITFSLARPLTTTIRATSQAQAERFARNRHPTLTGLEFLG
jgi:hypothetical protein